MPDTGESPDGLEHTTASGICHCHAFNLVTASVHILLPRSHFRMAILLQPWHMVICAANVSNVMIACCLDEGSMADSYNWDLFLLSIDEGISGYRDDSLETVKRNEQQVSLLKPSSGGRQRFIEQPSACCHRHVMEAVEIVTLPHCLCVDVSAIRVDVRGACTDCYRPSACAVSQYQLPLTVVSYKELYGWTMDEIVREIGTKNNCTFCGVFRRQVLPSLP